MREIPLTQGYIAIVDDEDYARVLTVGSWQADVDPHSVYAVCSRIKMHRFIAGVTAPSIEVDHRDGNGLNNQKYNLRVCTKRQNAQNRKAIRGKSQYKGVTWHVARQEWRANIRVNGKQKHLGAFSDERSAALAYDSAARLYFGEFSHCNFSCYA